MIDDPNCVEENDLISQYGANAEQDSRAADPMAASFSGHAEIVTDMVAAIREDRTPVISLASARHAVEIINSIYASGRKGVLMTLGD